MPNKPIFVGEQNPYGGDPEFALYPAPRGCAGERLCRVVLRLDPDDYLERFDRANLCAGPWRLTKARLHAKILEVRRDRGPLVLLGAKVCRAFCTPYAPFRKSARGFLVLPHPSGRCRAWNEPGAVDAARGLLLAEGVLP